MSSTLAVFLDLLVIGLMAATIVYAVSLNRSISKLRDGKAELATLLANLAEAVAHADVAIKGMKSIAGEYDNTLTQRIGTARALIDELGIVNETADNLASRIERAAQVARNQRPAEPLVALAADRGTRVDRPAHTTPKPMPVKVTGAKSPEAKPVEAKPSVSALPERKLTSAERAGDERDLIEAIALLRRTA